MKKILAIVAILVSPKAFADTLSPREAYTNFRSLFETNTEIRLGDNLFRYIANVSLGNYDPSAKDYCEPVIAAEIIAGRPIRINLQWDVTKPAFVSEAAPSMATFFPKTDGNWLSQLTISQGETLYHEVIPEELADIWVKDAENGLPTIYRVFSNASVSDVTATIQAYRSACRPYRS